MINLPPGFNGGAGTFECKVNYGYNENNSIVTYNIIQNVYDTLNNLHWTRMFYYHDNIWSDWTLMSNATNGFTTFNGAYFGQSDAEKDLNNITFNLYTAVRGTDNVQNIPSGQSGASGIFECKVCKNAHIEQRYSFVTTGRTWVRYNRREVNEWSDWKEVSYYYGEEELELINGFVKPYPSQDKCVVIRNGNMTTLQMSFKNPSSVADETIICKIPNGYIPKYYMRLYATGHEKDVYYSVDVDTRGEVRLRANNYSINTELRLNATWITK